MKTVTIEPFDTYLYREVWQITAMKDGCIYKTKSTKKFIHQDDEGKLDAEKFTTSSISTTIIKSAVNNRITLPLWEVL